MSQTTVFETDDSCSRICKTSGPPGRLATTRLYLTRDSFQKNLRLEEGLAHLPHAILLDAE